MQLTSRLLDYLHRVFSKDPAQFLALRLSYDGAMTWQVQDAVLTTAVTGGSGHPLSVDLTAYTVQGLANFLAIQQGYTIPYVDTSELSQLSARVLLDGGADIAGSNGDHLFGYTNVLWSYIEAVASELQTARDQIAQMLRQMSTSTAEDVWLDELGSYYAVPRLAGEVDASYGPRIITEVLRPRSNNVAIEEAIRVFTGQDTTVTDVVVYSGTTPDYNGAITHDGSHTHNATAQPEYGLFDVTYGYDLINGGSFAAFQQVIVDLIGRLRSAGTHLRALSLSGSSLDDAVPSAPTDSSSLLTVSMPLSDAAVAPTDGSIVMVAALQNFSEAGPAGVDSAALAVSYTTVHNSQRLYSGAIPYASGNAPTEVL